MSVVIPHYRPRCSKLSDTASQIFNVDPSSSAPTLLSALLFCACILVAVSKSCVDGVGGIGYAVDLPYCLDVKKRRIRQNSTIKQAASSSDSEGQPTLRRETTTNRYYGVIASDGLEWHYPFADVLPPNKGLTPKRHGSGAYRRKPRLPCNLDLLRGDASAPLASLTGPLFGDHPVIRPRGLFIFHAC